MNRRDILKITAASIITGVIPFEKIVAAEKTILGKSLPATINKTELAPISENLFDSFKKLLLWLKENGWTDYLNSKINLILDTTEPYDDILFKEITFNLNTVEGLDDFVGIRLIEPGSPAMSLLYHILASPRVKLKNAHDNKLIIAKENYPSVEQLDLLENFIYGIKHIELLDSANLILAVFAYEYRPAFKTPHCRHADLVYARTGIARIGNEEMHYDREKRCFTNEPSEKNKSKEIAVTPARYGLFLAEVVNIESIELMSEERYDDTRQFLKPIRKIFNGDLLINRGNIEFSEYHRNEKLHQLSLDPRYKFPPIFNTEDTPFIRVSTSTVDSKSLVVDNEMVRLTSKGSSVLLSSVPNNLVREAFQKEERLRFLVPKKESNLFSELLSNRRYTTLKTQSRSAQNGRDYILTEGFFKKYRPTRFSAPRNAPLFVNIRNEYNTEDSSVNYLGPDTENFEDKVNSSYWAALFEDSICDGCIAATVKVNGMTQITNTFNIVDKECLPAFSLVTAPDFFQYTDGIDLEEFDTYNSSNFLEGGIENLSTSRKRPNPNIKIPFTSFYAFPEVDFKKEDDKQSLVYDTLTAVVSNSPNNSFSKVNQVTYQNSIKDYSSTNFLPDAASFVFAPGWDVTYSGVASKRISKQKIFLATHGLGSPFPEDMKLCAAANGMWPASSPDSARTFQGSIEPFFVGLRGKRQNPTAIPLLDVELGFHSSSPAVKDYKTIGETFGWDGEQGPFLEKLDKQFVVNFTDLGRADYVKNALANKFDMSLLRDTTTVELLFRMDCLRKCIKVIDKSGIVAYSKIWLISAEKVDEWSSGGQGYGIPTELVDGNINVLGSPQFNLAGPGYIYVFASTVGKPILVENKGKRLRQKCKDIYLCKVSKDALAWCYIKNHGVTYSYKLKWRKAS